MATPKNRPDRAAKKRVPFGSKNRLSFNGLDPDFYYRVFNDTDDRISRALEAGYEHVESNERLGDSRVAESSLPGAQVAKPVGGGVTGYLMRIPREYYEEDQKVKEERLLETEKAMDPDASKNQYGGLKSD